MNITPTFIVVVVTIAIFYIRLGILRGQKKRYEKELVLQRRKSGGKSKGKPLPQKAPGSPPYAVTSWLVVALAILIMLVGVVAYNNFIILGMNLVNNQTFIDTYAQYWYIAVSAGVILLAFCIKVEKPKELN